MFERIAIFVWTYCDSPTSICPFILPTIMKLYPRLIHLSLLIAAVCFSSCCRMPLHHGPHGTHLSPVSRLAMEIYHPGRYANYYVVVDGIPETPISGASTGGVVGINSSSPRLIQLYSAPYDAANPTQNLLASYTITPDPVLWSDAVMTQYGGAPLFYIAWDPSTEAIVILDNDFSDGDPK